MATEKNPDTLSETGLATGPSTEGSKPQNAEQTGGTTGPEAVKPQPATAPQPPPAGHIVKHGTKTERELALERDLKAREMRLAELEDENHKLKSVPAPRPTPAAQQKKSWLQKLNDDLDFIL